MTTTAEQIVLRHQERAQAIMELDEQIETVKADLKMLREKRKELDDEHVKDSAEGLQTRLFDGEAQA